MTQRGELWWADFGERRGAAPAFVRPGLVVQADEYNLSRLRTVVLVTLTSNLKLAEFPGNILVPAEFSGLPSDSVAVTTQLATVDRGNLGEHIGVLPSWLLDDIDAGLRQVLAL